MESSLIGPRVTKTASRRQGAESVLMQVSSAFARENTALAAAGPFQSGA